MLRALPTILALLLATTVRSDNVAPRDLIPAKGFVLTARAVPLNADDPKQRRVGKLEFVAGWALTGNVRQFGGVSALQRRGQTFVALSDLGALFTFGPDLKRARLAPLPTGCGRTKYKSDQDAESLATRGRDGKIWLGLEFYNKICRITPNLATTERIAAPPAMKRWNTKNGAEAMTWLDDDRLAVFAESDPVGGTDARPLLIFFGDPTEPDTRVAHLTYRSPPGHRPVDAATLADGRVIVLNRRFSLPSRWSVIVTLIEPAQFKPGAAVKGKEIARFVPPVVTDNFEAIAAETTTDATHIWIASDDNFMPLLQRTLLLKFRLVD